MDPKKSKTMDVSKQLEILKNGVFSNGKLPLFKDKLKEVNVPDIKKGQLKILQLNIGYMCNQTCSHCHVDAGPSRKEMMSMEVLSMCLELMIKNRIETVDITGGAPEMHPNFRWFVQSIRAKTKVDEIIVRSNLTIILANKKSSSLIPRELNKNGKTKNLKHAADDIGFPGSPKNTLFFSNLANIIGFPGLIAAPLK